MKRESVVFLITGTFFGLLIGWMVGSQQAGPAAGPAAAPPAQAQQAAPATPVLDTARATELDKQAAADPKNATVRVELADVYFNAERFDLALPWYEAALKLDPKNVNASTDLGVCYYYLNQADKALAQFDTSLKLDPKHVKTLFNQGVVRAFGKQDLKGAEESWRQVVALAPDSEEGQHAKQGLEGLQSGHNKGKGGDTPDSSKGGRSGPGLD